MKEIRLEKAGRQAVRFCKNLTTIFLAKLFTYRSLAFLGHTGRERKRERERKKLSVLCVWLERKRGKKDKGPGCICEFTWKECEKEGRKERMWERRKESHRGKFIEKDDIAFTAFLSVVMSHIFSPISRIEKKFFSYFVQKKVFTTFFIYFCFCFC